MSQVWTTFIAGPLTSTLTAGRFTPDGNIRVTRIQVMLQGAPASCRGNAVVHLTDGTTAGTRQLSLASVSADSGAIAIDYVAGTPLTVGISVPANCRTNPQNANVVVQYRGF